LEKYAEMIVLDRKVVMFEDVLMDTTLDFDNVNQVRNSYEQCKHLLDIDDLKVNSELMKKLIKSAKSDREFIIKEES